MLTKEEINSNYNKVKELLRSTHREGIEELITYLDKTDFSIAPASTRYHGNFEGGLCAHSLKVYELLVKQAEFCEFKPKNEGSLEISGLLHDLAKIGTYEETYQNKKVYSDTGTKSDEGGKFDWVSVKGYKMKDLEERFVAGNHEETSAFIARQFIPLSIEEEVAISHHHGSMGYGTIKEDGISEIFTKYSLSVLLHIADLEAAYLYF